MQARYVPASDRIRLWNDLLRQLHRGGTICLSQGVAALGKDNWTQIVLAVASFGNFNQDNDPLGQHDCAMLAVAGRRVIWKIAYFDQAMGDPSPDPADARRTHRVLRIMLVDEL